MRWVAKPDTCDRSACLSNQELSDIVNNGANALNHYGYERLLRRLRQSCYLDEDNAPLTPQQRLMELYRTDGLVLFLGAGVSRGSENCRIPNWEGLSESMLKEVGAPPPEKLDPNDLNRVKKLLERFDQVYERLDRRLFLFLDKLYHYLYGKRLDRRQFLFLKKLYHCLYGGFDKTVRDLLRKIPINREDQLDWPRWDECRDALARNKSLAAVGDLLVTGNENQWRRNPQIHAVLTVNADNLLELYCRAKTRGRRLVTQVDRASVGDHPKAISVYHLHGTLDIRRENFCRSWWKDDQDDLLPDVVFRTSEYKKTAANPFSLVNHTPLSYLQRLNVLFFGTSLDDENIVRWLRKSYNERVEHRTKYLREMYRDKYREARSEAKWETVRHFWLCNKTEGGQLRSRTEMEKMEREKRELGVQIVWCEDYGLDCLRQMTGLLYFAYGSNMLSKRLKARVPSAVRRGIGYICRHRLTFDKPSADGSGKCNAAATHVPEDRVYGVIYEIDTTQIEQLDCAEGLGSGYAHKNVTVISCEATARAMIYCATHKDPSLRPYHWYKEYVLAGARENSLPVEYIKLIECAESVEDSDASRATRAQSVLRSN